MMTLYPYPNITRNGVVDIFNYTNSNMCLGAGVPGADMTCGFLGVFLLFAIFAITFISQKDTQPANNAFALSSFITFVISVIMLPLGITPIWTVELLLGVLIVSGILLYHHD